MAVFTHVTEEEVTEFLAGYALGRLIRVRGIREGTENTNYRLVTTAGRFILTLIERRTEESALPFIFGLMRHLAEAGAPVAEPVADVSGRIIRRLAGRPAVIVRMLDGRAEDDPAPWACAAAGAALARLHRAGASFGKGRTNPYGSENWPDLLAACGKRVQEGREDGHRAILTRCEEALGVLGARWPASSALPAGAVHADLFPDNMFFLSDQVSGIFDFYFACTDFWAYDLAIMLAAWCFDADNRFAEARARALVQGYDGERRLQDSERRALGILAAGAALRFTLTRLYDALHPVPEAVVTPKDPAQFAARLAFFRTSSDLGDLVRG